MDILTFIATVIGSLAWPVTLTGILFFLFQHGKKIAMFVKSIKYKDFEVTLRDDFEKATSIAEAIRVMLPEAVKDVAAADKDESEILTIARLDPALAIHKSWQKLDAKLTQLIQHNGLIRFVSPVNFVRRLRELEKLTPEDLELFSRLRRIRNEVVHAQERQRPLTIVEAVEYDQLVETLIARFEQIRNEPGYVGIDWEAYDARVKAREARAKE